MSNGLPPARRGSAKGSNSSEEPRGSGALAQPSPLAKLTCLAGPKAGEEFVLNRDEVVVGRAVENEISIPDTSVSRRHVRLKKGPRGWVVSDLGSGNGTLLNGQPLEGEKALRSGDVIGIGDTELSFVDRGRAEGVAPGGLARASSAALIPVRPRVRTSRGAGPRPSRVGVPRLPDPEAEKSRRRLFRAVVAFLLVGTGVLGWLKWRQTHAQAAADNELAAVQAHRAKLGALFQEGKNLVREEKWAEAKVKFDEVHEINPSYPMLQNYLDRAAKELPNEEALARAEGALSKDELGRAAESLAQVSADTQMDQRSRGAKTRLEEKIAARVAQARGLLEGGGPKDQAKLQSALAIARDVLAAAPEQRDAQEISKQATAYLAVLHRPAPSLPTPAGPKPWVEVIDRFREGDVNGAFALANACAEKRVAPCRALVTQIGSFADKFKGLEALSEKDLGDLDALDRKITEGQGSKMGRQIGTRLSASLYKKASAAKAAGNWERAMEYSRRILRHDPGNGGAQAIVNEARGKARDLYLQAYALKETNPEEAVKLFKDVQQMVPSDEELHGKAANWVQKLQK